MAQSDVLEFLQKSPGKRFSVSDIKDHFKLNSCSPILKKLSRYNFIKSEPGKPEFNKRGCRGLLYYYEKK